MTTSPSTSININPYSRTQYDRRAFCVCMGCAISSIAQSRAAEFSCLLQISSCASAISLSTVQYKTTATTTMFSWNSKRPSSTTTSTYPAQRVATTVQGSIRPPEYTRSQHIDSYLNDETLKRSTRKVSAGRCYLIHEQTTTHSHISHIFSR